MNIPKLEIYLIIVNISGFLLYLVNMVLSSQRKRGGMDGVLTFWAIAGGSVGILLAMLLSDRKLEKRNMMIWVSVICVFVIQIVMLLMVRGNRAGHVTLAFWEYFGKHRWILVYLIVVNAIAFTAFAADKIRAIKQQSRIPIVVLLGLAFIGGSIGSLAAMYLFRHKTQKNYFTVGIPLMMVMQMAVIFYMMNVR